MSIADTYREYSREWWTPAEWMVWAANTLQVSEMFDPCPRNWKFGQTDGLDIEWVEQGTYVNHPGDKRGAATLWWLKYLSEQGRCDGRLAFVWCAFNIEQFRYLRPSPLELPGWLVAPRERVSFIWGGPTEGRRIHGHASYSPGNWTVWWTNRKPAKPPVDSIIVTTG